VKQIEGSPVVLFVARAWCALMKEGQWDSNSVLVSPELQCVFALDGRRIVGCLTFHVDEGDATINIAYVVPSYRGRGVYRLLHDEFIVQAKAQEAKTVLNICYPSNAGIQETCKKLGYVPYVVHWKLKI
jgi:GNAT superfamily N-acetyltransferase